VPRLLLAAAGVSFTDDRIEFRKNEDGSYFRGDWEQRKPNTPYGQVPVLTVTHEGKEVQIAQSGAIVRFIARHHGLEGHNAVDFALVDGAFEAVADVRRGFFQGKSDAAKLAEFWSKTFPESVAQIEKNVQGNGRFLSHNKLTYADVSIYYLFFVLATENKEAVDAALNANAKVKAIFESVPQEARLAQYLASRKATPF